MTVIEGLIRTEGDGSLSFGNYELDAKSKVSDFEHFGDSYKVKTYKEITKLERNDLFVYESVPAQLSLTFLRKATKSTLLWKVLRIPRLLWDLRRRRNTVSMLTAWMWEAPGQILAESLSLVWSWGMIRNRSMWCKDIRRNYYKVTVQADQEDALS